MVNSIQVQDRVEVIDDFLPDDVFYPFAFSLMSSGMYKPIDYTAEIEEQDGSIQSFGEMLNPDSNLAEVQFQSLLFRHTEDVVQCNDYWLLNPEPFKTLSEHLNVKRWWQLRVNVTTGQKEPHTGSFHSDFPFDDPKFKTCILYLNSNNGGTKFRDTGKTVQSLRNRLVKFPTNEFHAGVWATDVKLRYVLNMTYEEK